MWNNTSFIEGMDPSIAPNGSSTGTSEDAGMQNFVCQLGVRFYINTLFAGPLCIIGLAGNMLSFLVMRRDTESPVASFLLMSLAMIDNFFLAFWFLHFPLNDMFEHFLWNHKFHDTWVFVRVYTYPLVFVGQTGMIWMTVLIAVSRYIAVCVPYKAQQLNSLPRMKLGVLLVVLLSFIYNIPRYFELTVIWSTRKQKYRFKQTDLATDAAYRLVYFDILYYIFTFVLPLLLLAVLNTQLVMAYRIIQKKRRALRVRSASSNQENNITLVMIIVIVVFMVCNAPARIFQIVDKYNIEQAKCWSASFLSGLFTTILEVLNSSANFVVYCVFRKKFWQQLRHWLCSCVTDKDPAKRPLNSTYTACTTLDNTAETEI